MCLTCAYTSTSLEKQPSVMADASVCLFVFICRSDETVTSLLGRGRTTEPLGFWPLWFLGRSGCLGGGTRGRWCHLPWALSLSLSFARRWTTRTGVSALRPRSTHAILLCLAVALQGHTHTHTHTNMRTCMRTPAHKRTYRWGGFFGATSCVLLF